MTDALICDIDGVISDCTERFRTLYEGKFIPQTGIPVFSGGGYSVPARAMSHLEITHLEAQIPAGMPVYDIDTGDLYHSDGQHLLRDLEPIGRFTQRNRDWVPDWTRFHDERMDTEPVHPDFVRLLRMLHHSHEVHLVTARSEEYRSRTVQYLIKNDVPYDELHMRHIDQGWENSKATAVRELIQRGLNIRLAIDDDGANRAIYENNGITFMHVLRGHHDGEVLPDN